MGKINIFKKMSPLNLNPTQIKNCANYLCVGFPLCFSDSTILVAFSSFRRFKPTRLQGKGQFPRMIWSDYNVRAKVIGQRKGGKVCPFDSFFSLQLFSTLLYWFFTLQFSFGFLWWRSFPPLSLNLETYLSWFYLVSMCVCLLTINFYRSGIPPPRIASVFFALIFNAYSRFFAHLFLWVFKRFLVLFDCQPQSGDFARLLQATVHLQLYQWFQSIDKVRHC